MKYLSRINENTTIKKDLKQRSEYITVEVISDFGDYAKGDTIRLNNYYVNCGHYRDLPANYPLADSGDWVSAEDIIAHCKVIE